MTRSEETYLDWIRDSQNERANGIYWMAQGMIDHLGEEEGKKLFLNNSTRWLNVGQKKPYNIWKKKAKRTAYNSMYRTACQKTLFTHLLGKDC